MYGQEKAQYAVRDYAGETAAMDPYTTQITNRLSEGEKYLTEITIQLSRIADKLVGPVPQEGVNTLSSEKLSKVSVGMMEQIVGQVNILNRKISSLGEVINRLQSL